MLRKLQKSEKDVMSTGTILSHMRLRRILKENHYSAIPSIAFNSIGHHKGLVGTVAKNQANIYDNQHVGTAFDLMCNFDNIKTEYTDGGVLNHCAWVEAQAKTNSLLAVAGESKDISVISVQDLRVTYLLQGHTDEIVGLCPIKLNSNTGNCSLLSISKDNTVRVWNVEKEQCVYVCEYNNPTSIAIHPTMKNIFFTSNTAGEIHYWSLDQTNASSTSRGSAKKKRKLSKKESKSIAEDTSVKKAITLTSKTLFATSAKGIDINQIITTERSVPDSELNVILVSKTSRGQIDVYDINPKVIKKSKEAKTVSTFKLEEDTGLCKMDVTSNGEYVCGGDDDGTVFIKNLISGKLVAELEYHRIKGQIQDIAVSEDSKYILFTSEYGLIFRFDFDPDQLKKNKDKANANIAD
jgi:WD40 repeat protein